ncbi:MAG TPA: TrbC/VirB2 family protein [Candidatus Paceibacterota bacterium]|nr:TrbC/VirB2 family protein [Candidatus Paceibacterota bacterium]
MSTTLNNPVPFYANLPAFVTGLLEIFQAIMIPVLVIAIIYAGYLFATAGDNEKQQTEAKHAFMWVLVGAAIILGAKIIAELIRATVASVAP